MGKTINATEAARAFSEIINSVKYKGESYTIIRGGKPAAVIVPVKVATPGRMLKELRAIVNNLPKLGKDAESFFMDYTIITANTRDFTKIEGLKYETL